jgi:arylsulfatase A-like enzyme
VANLRLNQQTLATPAIMHWPAGMKQKAGSITTERGHVIDMMATCIELAGGEYPEKFGNKTIRAHESLSLVPVINGKSQPHDHAYLFNHNRTYAVIQGDYKIVREGEGQWALYNLTENRTETKNIADAHPAVVQELSALWEARWGKKKRN